MSDLDVLAKASGATHKDKIHKNRYYRINNWIGHCEIVEQLKPISFHNLAWKWLYFGSKLPETAVEL